jgi:hypothetical protein
MNDRPINAGRPSRHASLRSTASWALLVVFLSCFIPAKALAESASTQSVDQPPDVTPQAYLPLISTSPKYDCPTTSTAHFDAIPVLPPPTDRPAAQHADLNLSLRSYETCGGFLGLVDYGGSTDPDAPQLGQLFGAGHSYAVTAVYQVYDWNWAANCRGALITNPPVTMIALGAKAGEAVRIPSRTTDIYQGAYRALVLYAEEHRITLKYTRNDNVVAGYTIHLENLCVDPNLLALYRASDRQGRASLPALRNGETLGFAGGGEIQVATRDNGSFMDPRSAKDWWRTMLSSAQLPVLPFTKVTP